MCRIGGAAYKGINLYKEQERVEQRGRTHRIDVPPELLESLRPLALGTCRKSKTLVESRGTTRVRRHSPVDSLHSSLHSLL